MIVIEIIPLLLYFERWVKKNKGNLMFKIFIMRRIITILGKVLSMLYHHIIIILILMLYHRNLNLHLNSAMLIIFLESRKPYLHPMHIGLMIIQDHFQEKWIGSLGRPWLIRLLIQPKKSSILDQEPMQLAHRQLVIN